MNGFVKYAVGAAALALASSAGASVLYDNPNSGYNTDAWTINFGFTVANSFVLSANSTVTGVDFAAWESTAGDLSGVDWEIDSGNPLSGGPFSVLASGTAGTSVVADLGGNGYGYDVSNNTFSTGSVNLAAGTYWLMLSNATNGSGDPVYWDQGDGPSEAWENSVGKLPGDGNPCSGACTGSETFQILGSGGVPEPATWALMLVGFAGLGAAIRSRRQTAAA